MLQANLHATEEACCFIYKLPAVELVDYVQPIKDLVSAQVNE